MSRFLKVVFILIFSACATKTEKTLVTETKTEPKSKSNLHEAAVELQNAFSSYLVESKGKPETELRQKLNPIAQSMSEAPIEKIETMLESDQEIKAQKEKKKTGAYV